MVLVYMLTWRGYIDGIHVIIYGIHGSYGIRSQFIGCILKHVNVVSLSFCTILSPQWRTIYPNCFWISAERVWISDANVLSQILEPQQPQHPTIVVHDCPTCRKFSYHRHTHMPISLPPPQTFFRFGIQMLAIRQIPKGFWYGIIRYPWWSICA